MKKKKMKKSSKTILLLLLVLVLASCGYFGYRYFFKGEEVPFLDLKEPAPEKPKVQIIDEDSKSRPYGVMVNNIAVARNYHSGLQDAYLVYEMIVEGGITRLYALFLDTDTTRIGPVRSARPYYLDYAMENDAYFVHWGFSEQAKSDINTYHIQNINGLYKAQYFWRDTSLNVATEHTAFTSMEKLKQAPDDLGYRKTREKDFLLDYSVDEILFDEESSQVANEILIPYSNGTKTSYVYDEENKVYKRYVNGEVHKDYVTKEQYTVKNIITYQVKNTSLDSYGRQKLDNVGSGTGYYISNGKAIPIRYEKKSRDAQTKYTYLDGTELVVNDGNTWIQIQPENQKLTIS